MDTIKEMDVEKKPIKESNAIDTQIFSHLFEKYSHEMKRDNSPIGVSAGNANEILKLNNTTSYLIVCDFIVSGFFIVEENPSNGNYRILDFYIIEEKKNKGIGLGMMKKILEEKDGDCILYVPSNNERALSFFGKVFESNKCEKFTPDKSFESKEGMELIVLKMPKKGA